MNAIGKLLGICLGLGAVASSSAVAGSGKLSAGYNHINSDLTLGAIVTRYQRDVIAYRGVDFGAEGELSYGVIGDTTEFLAQEIEVDAQFGYGAYATAAYPLTKKGTNLFVRLGYARQEIGNRLDETTITNEVDGFAYGLGGNWMFTDRQGVRADALVIQGGDEDTDDLDVYSFSYVFQH